MVATAQQTERATSRPTSERVWQHLADASFAVVSQVSASGQPRSSGVIYKAIGRRLYVAIAPDSWKARQLSADEHVAVTVPIRRGGILALLAPIPPATISLHGTARVLPAGSREAAPLLDELGSLLPEERRASSTILEITPVGSFVTYGLDIPLLAMRDPARARARVPVGFVTA